MRFLRKNSACIIIVAIYILCILAVNPRGEFPLNDDWSYVRSAFALGNGHGLKVDEWSAPSLIGQALYGGLLVKLFSPDFLALRISTLALSCLMAFLLWSIFLRVGFRKDLACVMLLAWIFNPLQFNLSFTFMTEIPFLFFVALATYLYVVHLDSQKTWLLVLSAAALGYAFLIRQPAIFFILALLCSVLLDFRKPVSQRARQCLLSAGAAGAFIAAYYLWSAFQGGATAALNRKFELLSYLTTKQLTGNAYGMLFYLAFMLLPAWLFLIPSVYGTARRFGSRTRIAVLAAWSLMVIVGLWWFRAHCPHMQYLPSTAYHARMPFLLNVLYDTGLGPVTLDPDYFGPPQTPIYPRLWLAITAAAGVGAAVLGMICTFGIARWRNLLQAPARRPICVFASLAFLCIVPFEIVFSHLQEGGLFDRHVLTAALPLCFVLGFFSRWEEKQSESPRTGISAFIAPGIVLAALIFFCVAATHDYLEWNRIRWDMGSSLLQRGVNPLYVAGGFEFNAWHNYDTFVARGNVGKVYHWWYDRRDYSISMKPDAGYVVLDKKGYFSWLHRRPIFLYLYGGRTNGKPLE